MTKTTNTGAISTTKVTGLVVFCGAVIGVILFFGL